MNIRWVERVECMSMNQNTHKGLVGKSQSDHLEDLLIDRKIILKLILK